MNSIGTAVCIFLVIELTVQNKRPCIPRGFGQNSIVCVCNATYCDTIPRPHRLPEDQYISYTSTLSGLRFKKKQGKFQVLEDERNANVLINIDSEKTYQKIFGWGGAFTDATGINIKSLSSEAADKLLKSYFSDDGLEYNIGRVPIGGTDFSTHAYSYDDGEEDVKLSNFKLAFEDHEYKIPLIRKACNLTNYNLQLFASAWTAPKWMKYNGEYTGPDFLKTSMYQVWANYFLKFLQDYKQEDVDFWGITTGNEPFTGLLPVQINSVGWLPWQMQKWVAKNLGPTIRNSEFSHLKIIGVDDQIFMFPWLIEQMFEDQKVKDYMDGFGLHWYLNRLFSYGRLTKTHMKYSDKFILGTEACEGFRSWEAHVLLGEWDRAESYARDIINDLQNWVIGWVDWNMALNITGGPTYINNNVDSPIIVNATAGEFYKQPMFYALGHFSKFIQRGSYRISVKQSKEELDLVGFIRPDNATVIVVLNRNDHDVKVKIKDKNNIERELLDVIQSRSINTFLYW